MAQKTYFYILKTISLLKIKNKIHTDTNDLENNTFSIGQHPILNKENSTINTTKQGRQLLKQYLQEIGYTDTIIDVRSSRLRALLGIKASNNNANNGQSQEMDVLASATNALNTNNNNNQLDSIVSLINGNKQLLLNTNSANKRANLSPTNQNSQSPQQHQQPMVNGQLNTSDVQKMLKLSESDPHSMLMMTNLDLITNQNDSNAASSGSNATSGGINNSNFNADDEEMNDDDEMTGIQSEHTRYIVAT